jgi:hypothetical protein
VIVGRPRDGLVEMRVRIDAELTRADAGLESRVGRFDLGEIGALPALGRDAPKRCESSTSDGSRASSANSSATMSPTMPSSMTALRFATPPAGCTSLGRSMAMSRLPQCLCARSVSTKLPA